MYVVFSACGFCQQTSTWIQSSFSTTNCMTSCRACSSLLSAVHACLASRGGVMILGCRPARPKPDRPCRGPDRGSYVTASPGAISAPGVCAGSRHSGFEDASQAAVGSTYWMRSCPGRFVSPSGRAFISRAVNRNLEGIGRMCRRGSAWAA